jgi:hypothetical protein
MQGSRARRGEGVRVVSAATGVSRVRRSLGLVAAALALGAAALPGPARAGESAAQPAAETELRRLQDAIAGQRRAIEGQSRILERQQRELDELEKRLSSEAGREAGATPQPAAEAAPQLPHVSQGPVAPKPVPPTTSEPTQPAPEVEPTPEEATAKAEAPGEERPKSERPIDQLLVEAGAVLLPRGMLQIEPGAEYSHFTNSAVAISGFSIFNAIVIGTISVDRVDRDLVSGVLTARYGLPYRLQLETRVPLIYRREEELFGVGTSDQLENVTDNVGIGDVEASLLWQALIGRGALPHVVTNVRGRFPTGEDAFHINSTPIGPGNELRLDKPPTGSGFYGVSLGYTALWRTDPVVFFLGNNYNLNLERNQGSSFGDIDPGDTLDTFFGTNVALSDRVSLNLSFATSYTWETRQASQDIDGSNFTDARLILGTSIGLNPRTSLIVAAAAGLTDESPDFQVTVRLPFTFNVPLPFWD